MPIKYTCPICDKDFGSREAAIDHIKEAHRDHVNKLLSNLSERRIKGLKKRGIDPENWAAGYMLSM